jgi:hypothetical protein
MSAVEIALGLLCMAGAVIVASVIAILMEHR